MKLDLLSPLEGSSHFFGDRSVIESPQPGIDFARWSGADVDSWRRLVEGALVQGSVLVYELGGRDSGLRFRVLVDEQPDAAWTRAAGPPTAGLLRLPTGALVVRADPWAPAEKDELDASELEAGETDRGTVPPGDYAVTAFDLDYQTAEVELMTEELFKVDPNHSTPYAVALLVRLVDEAPCALGCASAIALIVVAVVAYVEQDGGGLLHALRFLVPVVLAWLAFALVRAVSHRIPAVQRVHAVNDEAWARAREASRRDWGEEKKRPHALVVLERLPESAHEGALEGARSGALKGARFGPGA